MLLMVCTRNIGDGFCIFPVRYNRECMKFGIKPLPEGCICRELQPSSSRSCKDVRLSSTGSPTASSFISAGRKEKGRVVPLDRYRNIGIMAHIDAGKGKNKLKSMESGWI